jgi:DNA-binding IscR family transcriptional regulator
VRLPGARADLIDLLQRLGPRPTSTKALAQILGRSTSCVSALLTRLRSEGVVATRARRGCKGGFVVAVAGIATAAVCSDA